MYNNGDYRAARYYFEQVLSVATLPNNVRINIKNFLRLIRRELPSLELSLNLAFNEKIPDRYKEAFYLGGLEFDGSKTRYQDTGIRQDSYTFTLFSKIPINAKQQTFVKLTSQHKEIINNEKDSTYLKATIGKHYQLSKSATITPEVGIHHLIYKDKKLYNGKTFSLQYFKPIATADYLNLTYNHRQLGYIENYKSSNGVQNEYSIGYIKLPSIDSRLDASVSLLKSNVEDKSQSFDRLSLNLSYNQDITGIGNIGLNFRTNRTQYRAVAVYDKEIKKDKQTTYEITLLNGLWQINNIAPKFYFGTTKKHSNIDNYGKSEPYIKLGFTQQF